VWLGDARQPYTCFARRLQLKTIEPVLGKYVKFDYTLNNWQLYMQVQTALFLAAQNEK